jgi:nucleotide-binding universal stress UspA family protein
MESAMSIRTILAAASGGTASKGAIELACQFARRFSAHVEGFHAKPDPQDLFTYGGADLSVSMTADFIDRFASDATALANQTREAFLAAIGRHEIKLSSAPPGAIPPRTGCSASWREETGFGSALVARRARFFDLTVLGRSERVVDQPYSDAVEQTLLHSGRPVLLAPAAMPTDVGGTVAVGWNGSAEAVRALTSALPFLGTAQKTFLITIGDKHGDSAACAIDYLAWHDIIAKHRHVPAVATASPGQQLLGEARDIGADLLVIGGYSRMPWREYLFGGATSELVGVSLLPLLLSH